MQRKAIVQLVGHDCWEVKKGLELIIEILVSAVYEGPKVAVVEVSDLDVAAEPKLYYFLCACLVVIESVSYTHLTLPTKRIV